MKISIIFCFVVLLNLLVFAQEERYTHGAENGYVWVTLNTSPNPITNYKEQYLASMLETQRMMIRYGKQSAPPLNCIEDISELNASGYSDVIALSTVADMIDQFYLNKENMIIPIMGAYCYNIKLLAEYSSEDLEKYRQELLIFSKE